MRYDALTYTVGESPKYTDLIINVSAYVLELRQNASGQTSTANEPATKKRKIDDTESAQRKVAGSWLDPSAKSVYTAPDVSFSVPQRKKLNLQILHEGIRAIDATGNVEFGVSWDGIEQVFCLPVPEKQKRAWNYVVIPKGNDGLTVNEAGAQLSEQMVWTYQELSAKEAAASSAPAEPHHTAGLLDQHLAPMGKSVVEPDEKEFASAVPQSHRKGEKAYHVKAFRGSKEGYLFFLPTGVLWAFKKPLTFFPFAVIESLSYTSVLQRTFNMVITTNSLEARPQQEIEFGMMDQADFAGIDAYVKAHGLNDASLAKVRAAKIYGVNADKTKKGDAEANGSADANGEAAAADEEMTELQKAEQQLEDEEDEEEEDYDPGSEGESEGEGGSSEDEGYDEGEAYEEEVEAAQEEEGEEEGDAEGDEDDEEEEDAEDGQEEAVDEPIPLPQRLGFPTINGNAGAPEEPDEGFL